MEDGGSGKKMTEEEILEEIQAAEEADHDEGEGAEEEGSEQLDEADQKIYEAITKDNMKEFLAEATAYKVNKNFERACQIIKLILMKGEAIYKDPLHIDLVSYYYMMGDFLMEEIEDEGEHKDQEAVRNANGQATDAPTPDAQNRGVNMLESGVDPEVIQSAWENLETARHILQKRLDEGVLGDEEKKAVLNKLAIIYSRIGDCECWQDKFKEAVEAYQHCLLLREQFENSTTSRPIAETYFMIGNAMVYEKNRPPGCSPVDYYSKAATILENILMEKYEKAGVEVVIDQTQLIKRQLLTSRPSDDAAMMDIKGILGDLYQRIEDTKLEEQIKKEYEAVKKRQEEENKQALNAFGKPIEETEDKKVKNLGIFGKKAAPAEQKPAQTQGSSMQVEEKSEKKPEASNSDDQEGHEKQMTRVKLN